MHKVQQIIRSEMAKSKGAKEKLLVYINVYDNFLHHPFPDGGCPILNTATESDDTHPALKKRAAAAIHSWKQHIVHLIEKGVNSGEFRKNTDAEKIALTMIAGIEGAIMITKLTGNKSYWATIIQGLRELVMAI